jgi:NHL repeat
MNTARRLALATLALVLAALAFSSAPAFAGETHLFEESFGPDGTTATAFEQPEALGVDQSTGEIYVADNNANTVQKFNLAHEPEAFTGIAPNIVGGKLTGFGFGGVGELAVNSASHDFYVANNASQSVRAYQSDGEPADFTAGPGVGTNELGFSELCGVAVGTNGDIFASDYFTGVHVYAPSGEPLASFSPGEGTCGVAVDANGIVYLSRLTGATEKFTPSEFTVTASTTYAAAGVVDKNASYGVAVDLTTNDLYVDEHNRVAEYDEVGKLLGTFGAAEPGAVTASQGLAVDGVSGHAHVYVSDTNNTEVSKRHVEVFGPPVVVPDVTTGAATEIRPTSATLNGTVNPDGVEVTGCRFDYVPQAQFEASGYENVTAAEKAPCEHPDAKEIPVDSIVHAVSAKVTGLTNGTTYHVRLQAENAVSGRGFGADATLSTQPKPAISGASVSNLSASSVDLSAQINPGGLPLQSCVFEYGIEAGVYPEKVVCTPALLAQIGSGSVPVPISQHVEGLSPNKTYHWRVVATNEAGTTTGLDHTFIYPESGVGGVGGLSDNRAYEMVTPLQKNGALIGNFTFAPPPDVSEDGSRVILGTTQCFGGVASCVPLRQNTGTPYEFGRTAGGWTPTPLAPSAAQLETNTWLLYSADAETTLFSAPTPPEGHDDFYARSSGGSFTNIGPLGPGGPDFSVLGETSVAASADLSHVVYRAPAVWPGSGGGSDALFEYTHSGSTEPTLVGVSGGEKSTDLISSCATLLGGVGPGTGAALSTDGRIVYFTAGVSSPTCTPGTTGTGANVGLPVPVGELYARVDGGEAGAHTVSISEPQAPEVPAEAQEDCKETLCQKNTSVANQSTNWRAARFQGASTDGSKAFFTSTQQLTDTASQDPNAVDEIAHTECAEKASENGCNLYLYDLNAPVGHRLVDASAGDVSGGGPRVQGVLAFANDGSHVYFVAKGVLTSTPNGRGQSALDGAENLYVFERDAVYPGGRLVFISVLPPSDFAVGEELGGGPGHPANVTPDGRFLVFTSTGDLTADTTRTDGGQQIFRYDAQSEELVRISIGENGFNDNGNLGAGNAQIVAGVEGYRRAGAGRPDPTMSNDGAYVFFMSPVALTAGALSSVPIGHAVTSGGAEEYAENVYEYHEGNVSLISDGRDTSVGPQTETCAPSISLVCLIGSDASGKNVFFTTADQLVPQDTDTQVDVYDARICEPETGNPCIGREPIPLAPCLGESCHGIPPATPGEPSGGSATLNAAGNLTQPRKVTKKTVKCPKSKHRSHGKCIRNKPKKHRKPAAKKAGNDRRAKS